MNKKLISCIFLFLMFGVSFADIGNWDVARLGRTYLANDLSPAINKSNSVDLGTTSYLWRSLYLGTSLNLGASGSAISITTTPAFTLYTTTSYASTSTVRSMLINLAQTADTWTSQTEALRVNVSSEYITGDWTNAIVARLDFGTTGDARGGMAAPLCSELNYPGKACAGVGGAYYVLDLEMNCPANFTVGTNLSYPNAWVNFGIWGNATAIGSWEDYGFLFRFDGFTPASGNVIYNNTIRSRIGSTTWYHVLSSAEGEFETAYLIDVTNTTDATGTTDGSIQTDGGVGIAKKLYVGDLINATSTNTVAGGKTGIYSYLSHDTNALTSELIGIRGNARVNVASAAGTVIGGKFQAGNMSGGFDLATATGVYVDVVNKDPTGGATTWTNARGYEVSMDLNQGTSGNVNTITNAYMFYGVYNLPTVDNYATVTNGYGIFVRNEAVGGTGQMLDAAFYADDRSMSGGIKGWDYGVDFSGMAAGFGTSDLKLSSGAMIFTGSAANGDAVYAEVGSKDAKGSIYLSTANGYLYIQVANAGAATDWYKVTAADAD